MTLPQGQLFKQTRTLRNKRFKVDTYRLAWLIVRIISRLPNLEIVLLHLLKEISVQVLAEITSVTARMPESSLIFESDSELTKKN